MKKFYILISFLILIGSQCFANEVYFLDINSNNSIDKQYLEVASNYYGIEMIHFDNSNAFIKQIAGYTTNNTVDAIIISSDSLSHLDYAEFFNILKNNGSTIKILIYGISPEHMNTINLWSNGTIKNIGSISKNSNISYYSFSANNIITRQLSALSLRNKSDKIVHYLDMENSVGIESIINFYAEGDRHLFPVFARMRNSGSELFFVTKIEPDNATDQVEKSKGRDRFYELAPMMMFLRYACEDRCWHSDSHYANLTIDDPWLREPYGHLNYNDLLQEMNKEYFHTSIAFIPWNYDRSDNIVVSLIRNNSKKYSIAIHGNDHNHQEFYPLKKNDDIKNKEDLRRYEIKIQQARARMEKFNELTKIPYDPVMIFPHRIAPLYAIGLLKKNGYLATVNSRNVPFGSQGHGDPGNRLRSVTMDFEGFASYRRQELFNINKEDFAIELYLDNPIFLYTHQDYFAGDIRNVNPVAKDINKLQPDVIWGSLGYIIRNYHLKKLRNDGNYEILMFANELELTNDSNDELKYFIKKKEIPSYIQILKISVDGRPVSYLYDNEYITFEVTIPKQKSREISIKYGSEMAYANVDFSKNNYYFAGLRYISDFRDIVLTKNEYTHKFVEFYYNPDRSETIRVLTFVTIGFIIAGFILICRNKNNIRRSRKIYD